MATFKPGDKVRAKIFRDSFRANNDDVWYCGSRGPFDRIINGTVISDFLDMENVPAGYVPVQDRDRPNYLLVREDEMIMGWEEPAVEMPSLRKYMAALEADPARRKRDAMLAEIFGPEKKPLPPIVGSINLKGGRLREFRGDPSVDIRVGDRVCCAPFHDNAGIDDARFLPGGEGLLVLGAGSLWVDIQVDGAWDGHKYYPVNGTSAGCAIYRVDA